MYEEQIKKTEMKKNCTNKLWLLVATPLVVICYKKITANSVDQPMLTFNVLHSVLVLRFIFKACTCIST